MFKLTTSICALVMAASAPFAGPAVAMPTGAPAWDDRQNVMEVGSRNRLERRGSRYYYNGHPGYREYRRGYRRHSGLWFPPAAFIAGAILGGVLSQQPSVRYRSSGSAHVQWCYNRYRSYREWDNTFQPYNGPRRPCYSPYG